MTANPQRTCVGCRRVASRGELRRVAAGSDGALGTGATAPGRGAWVCSPECLDAAMRRKALARALRRPVSAHEAALARAKLFG